MPWKNGGGSTTEIAVSPPGAGFDVFVWRLSRAEIRADGPFSRFPGIDRTLAILAGEGITLTIGDHDPTILTPDSPQISFPGDVAADAVLEGGAVEDLNVMTRRDRCCHRMRRWEMEGSLRLPVEASTVLIYCREGGATVEMAGEVCTLDAADTVISEDGAPGEVVVRTEARSMFFMIEIW